jgi:chaperonin cofactor prefoldin
MLTDVTVKPRDRELEKDEIEHHGFFRAFAWVILAFAIGAVAWYAYPSVKRYQAQFTQFAGAQKMIDGIGDQVKQTDAKIETWASDQQGLRDQIARLRTVTRAQLDAAAKHAEESSQQIYERIQAQIDERFGGVQARLDRVESSGATGQARIDALQSELDQTRRDLAKQAVDLAAVRQEAEQTGAIHERQLATLQATGENARRDVDALQQKLAVRRVDFEVPRSHSRELAAGISLNITRTDAARRTISGWISVLPDRRTIWLKSQNTEQPVIFYGSQDGQKRELVITNVTQNSVVGFLLLPAGDSELPAGHAGE